MSDAEVQDAPQQEVEAQEEEYVMPKSFALEDDESTPDYSVEPGQESKAEPEPEAVEAQPEEVVEGEAAAEEVPVEEAPTEEEDIVAKVAAFRAKAIEEKNQREETNELDTYRTKASRFEELERLKHEDPLKFIKESGLDFNSIAEQHLTIDQKPTADHKLSQQDQRLAQLEAQNKSLVERLDHKENEQRQNYFIGQIKDFVDNNNKYDLIQQTDSYFSVLQEADEFFKDTGQQLEVEDACKLVTKNLRGIAKRFYSSEALANEFGYKKSQTDDSPQQPTGDKKVIAGSPKTLTNSMSAQPSVEKEEDILKMDKRDRIAKAASMLQFTD